MQRIQKIMIGAVIGVSLGFQRHAKAEDKSSPAGGSPEMAAMMEKAKKYMTPGENHRLLDPLVGKWNAKIHSTVGIIKDVP